MSSNILLNTKCLVAKKSWQAWRSWKYIYPSKKYKCYPKYKWLSTMLNLLPFLLEQCLILKTKRSVRIVIQTWLKDNKLVGISIALTKSHNFLDLKRVICCWLYVVYPYSDAQAKF